jgi:hypothetical protein
MILYNFGPVIDIMSTHVATVTRYAVSTVGADGYTTNGTATTFNNVKLSVQPASADLYRKMEADYNIELFVIFTSFTLIPRDTITVGSKSYQVEKIENWDGGMAHFGIAREI